MRDAFRSFLALPAAPDTSPRSRVDGLLVTALIVLGASAELTSSGSSLGLLGVALSVLVPLALLWRRTLPLVALAGPLAVRVAWGMGGVLVGLDLSLIVLTFALLRWGSGRAMGIGAGVVALAVVAEVSMEWSAGTPGITLLDAAVRWLIPAAVGYTVRVRDEAARARVLDARRSERVEIARELHDTLAHHVTAIAIQAQAAQAVASSRPQAAIEALAAIEEAASRALVDMRATVGALRNGGEAERAPQRGVADLPDLASHGTGVPVDVEVADGLGRLGPTVEAGLFRVAQEAVTNAQRHARHAQRISVRLTAAGDDVTLVISDDGRPTRTAAPGFGLIGMKERAELLGGQLSAGPALEGGWRVQAVLPRVAR